MDAHHRKRVFFGLALARVAGVGNVIYRRLIEKFQTPEKVFQASPDEIREVEGIRSSSIEAIHHFKNKDWVERELDRVENLGITLVSFGDKDYPENLKTIYDPPPILYIKGKFYERDHRAIAMVGSRNASSYGREITAGLARSLCLNGFTIVSGLARGIDTVAHQAVTRVGRRTLAILGSGLDVIYPRENRALSEEIVANGAVISEFPLGTPPEAAHFPARNRIISGLSLGTVIIEASLRSGSLITARLALEQGREVFAVPGNVNSVLSKGANRLIGDGAKLVMGPEDIVEELLPQVDGFLKTENENPVEPTNLNPEMKKLLDLIGGNPTHIDGLIQKSGLPSNQVSSLLLNLELEGLVKQLSGKMFKRLS